MYNATISSLPVLRIRQTDDLDTVFELDRECFPHDKKLKGNEFDHSVWWVAEYLGTPVGYAGLHPQPTFSPDTTPLRNAAGLPSFEKTYLCRAGVLPEARGKGIQRRLVQARVAYSKKLGVPRAYTYVSTANIASMKTLVRCGFVPYHYMFEDLSQSGFIYFEKVFKTPVSSAPVHQ